MKTKFTMFVESVAHPSGEVSRIRTRYGGNIPATNSTIEKHALIFGG
jgi:hypothetical protein